MFSTFTRILKIPISLHKEIQDENVLLLSYMMTLHIVDRNDLNDTLDISKVPSTIVKERLYYGQDIVVYKYLSSDFGLLLLETNPILYTSNLIFINGAYMNKKIIVKLEKNSDNTYELIYYYNNTGINKFLNGDIHTSYFLKYLFDRQEKINILKKTNSDLKNILTNSTSNRDGINIKSCHIFKNIKLFNYQKSDIQWMKCIESNVDNGVNVVSFDKLFSYNILDDKYVVSCDLKNVYPKCIVDSFLSNIYFNKSTMNFSYYGGNIISEVGLGKTLIMLYTILSDPNIDNPLYNFVEYDNKTCNYFYKLGNKKGTSCTKNTDNDSLYCKDHCKTIFIDKKKIKYCDYFNAYFDIKNYISPEQDLINTKSTLIVCPSHLCDQWVNEYYNRCNDDIKSKTNVLLVTTYNQYYNLTVGDVLFSDIVIISYNFFTNINYHKKSKSFGSTFNHMLHHDFINKREFSFHMFKWRRVVFEEFHEISNMYKATMIFNKCMSLKSTYKWNISGTPFTNGVYGFMDSLKLNTSLSISYFERSVESNSIQTLCQYGLNSDLIDKCAFLFKRNTKESVMNEYQGNLIHYNTKLLSFTQEERNIYDSHLVGFNTKYYKFLLQLCCHPELYSETKKLIANCKTLSEIQSVLLKHHEINLNDSLKKIKLFQIEIDTLNSDIFIKTCSILQQKLSVAKRNLTNEKKIYQSIKNTLNYLTTAIETINLKESCPICLEDIEHLTITTCGHKFCLTCFEEFTKTSSIHKCPLCKTTLTQRDIFLLKENVSQNNDTELNQMINEIKSTKIGNIVYWLKNEIQTNKNSKIIIFSQWDELLHKVGEYITKYNINVLYCKGSVYQKKKSIHTFSNDPNYNIIMLSSQNAASGINLTKANKIVFVETIIGDYQYRTNTENQAIGRSSRIGNKQEIDIVKFIIKDTIESEIHNNTIDDKFLLKL